jgi:hypothetical protein
MWEYKDDSDFLLMFCSAEHKDTAKFGFGPYGAAIFPAKLRDDVVDVHADDIIKLRGALNFSDIGNSISVEDCQLLERHKS